MGGKGKDGKDHGNDGKHHGKFGKDHGNDGKYHGKDGKDHGKDGKRSSPKDKPKKKESPDVRGDTTKYGMLIEDKLFHAQVANFKSTMDVMLGDIEYRIGVMSGDQKIRENAFNRMNQLDPEGRREGRRQLQVLRNGEHIYDKMELERTSQLDREFEQKNGSNMNTNNFSKTGIIDYKDKRLIEREASFLHLRSDLRTFTRFYWDQYGWDKELIDESLNKIAEIDQSDYLNDRMDDLDRIITPLQLQKRRTSPYRQRQEKKYGIRAGEFEKGRIEAAQRRKREIEFFGAEYDRETDSTYFRNKTWDYDSENDSLNDSISGKPKSGNNTSGIVDPSHHGANRNVWSMREQPEHSRSASPDIYKSQKDIRFDEEKMKGTSIDSKTRKSIDSKTRKSVDSKARKSIDSNSKSQKGVGTRPSPPPPLPSEREKKKEKRKK